MARAEGNRGLRQPVGDRATGQAAGDRGGRPDGARPWLWLAAAFLCGFGLGAFRLLGRLSPFPAAVTASAYVDRSRPGKGAGWVVVVGVLAGLLARAGLVGCLAGAAPMSLVWLLFGYPASGASTSERVRPDRQPRVRGAALSAVTAAAVMLAQVPVALVTQAGLEPTRLIAEATLSGCVVYLLARSPWSRWLLRAKPLPVLFPGSPPPGPSSVSRLLVWDKLCLGVLACAATSGLDVVRVGPLSLGLTVSVAVVGATSLAGGASLGAAAGTIMGLASWLSSPASEWRLGALASTGLIVGAARDLGLQPWVVGVAGLAAWALTSARLRNPSDIMGFAAALCSGLLVGHPLRRRLTVVLTWLGWPGSSSATAAAAGPRRPQSDVGGGFALSLGRGHMQPEGPSGGLHQARSWSEDAARTLSGLARSLEWAVRVALGGSVQIPRPLVTGAGAVGRVGAVGCPASSQGRLLSRIAARLCNGCPNEPACWGRYLVRTQAALTDAAAWVELRLSQSGSGFLGRPRGPAPSGGGEGSGAAGRDLPQFRWCVRGGRVVSAVRSSLVWAGEDVGAGPASVAACAASDLRLLSSVLRAVSAGLPVDRVDRFDLAGRLELRLARAGLQPARVGVVTGADGGRPEASVTLARCPCHAGHAAMCKTVAAIVGAEALGERLEAWPTDCPLEGGVAGCTAAAGSGCSFTLRQRRRFELELAVRKAARANGAISGDSHVYRELPDGRVVVALSDGMGTGPAAAIESGTALALLVSLMESGFDAGHAVRIVNSLIAARCGGERFVTLDLAIIDLHSGSAEMVKVGGCPSFLVGRRGVAVESGQGLPVGFTSSIKVETTRRTMADQDYLVMVSDGVLCDAPAGPQGSGVDRLARDLASLRSCRPDVVAARIMSRARSSEPPRDDITVLVARLVSRNGSTNARTAG